MHNFRELNIWKKSMDITKEVYSVSADFPSEEKYALTSQIRRSAISIPSNIAEGCGRKSDKELSHFLSISLGSCFELETQIELASMLNFIDQSHKQALVNELTEIQKMISGFTKKTRTESENLSSKI
ncbi:MAG: four helix bundle protein [Bacteroidota bacterium]